MDWIDAPIGLLHVKIVVYRTIRRGGYQPPAQHKLKSQEMSGEFVPVFPIYTIQPNTQVRYLTGGW